MAYTSISANVGPLLANGAFDLTLDRGRLKSATLSLAVTPGLIGASWATLRLYAETHTDNQIITELGSGWIGERQSISWTGDIPLSSGMMLGADILSELTTSARIAAVTDEDL